jgi:hypothetical protein
MSDSDGDELDPRRARAMMLLAKALKGHQGGGAAKDSPTSESLAAEEELVFLKSLLQLESHTEVVQSMRDRVNVLRMRIGSSSVTAHQSSTSTDANSGWPPRKIHHHSTAPEAASPDVIACLKQVQDGQLNCVEPAALEASFWRALVPEMAAAEPSAPVAGGQPWLLDCSHLFANAKSDLHADGYCVLPPTSPQSADERTEDEMSRSRLNRLQLGARRLQALGWPPVFLFMFDDAWEVLDGLWPVMRGILGEDCELDPSVFCWVARVGRGAGRDAAQRTELDGAGATREEEEDGRGAPAGSNFGVPHRDFTCLDSIADGEPRLLSTWVPLTPVTADNGCMLVVPRALDRHFSKRWAYAHMRPATKSVEGVTEVRFDLQAVRAVAPLRPGSVVAWNGNLVHWGTCCTAADQPPRVSVGFNFFRRGVRLQSGAPNLTQESARALSLQQRLAIISRSLLAYSSWYKLGAKAVPPGLFRQVPA